MTLQLSFFFPTVACTFAVPSPLPVMFAVVLFFFFKEMNFSPDKIFQVTFFFVFFTVNDFFCPFVKVSFFLFKQIFFAASPSVIVSMPITNEKMKR
jgi:hypothetical protein